MCDKSFDIPFELDNMGNGYFWATNMIKFQLKVEMCDKIPWSNWLLPYRAIFRLRNQFDLLYLKQYRKTYEWMNTYTVHAHEAIIIWTRCDDMQNVQINA